MKGLQSLMISPVQRVPRYKLLLQEMLKMTPLSHADRADLRRALKAVSEVATHINEEVRTQENRRAIRRIEKEFLYDPGFVAPHRLLIRRGPLLKQTRHENQLCEFFLFSDILVRCSVSAGLNVHVLTSIEPQAYARMLPFPIGKYQLNRKIQIDASFSVGSIQMKEPDEEVWILFISTEAGLAPIHAQCICSLRMVCAPSS